MRRVAATELYVDVYRHVECNSCNGTALIFNQRYIFYVPLLIKQLR